MSSKPFISISLSIIYVFALTANLLYRAANFALQ
jgi:hypothetical protein